MQLLLNGLVAGSIYALVALGFGLIYSTARFIHFAHGAIYALGAYFAYFFIVHLQLPFALAVVCSILLTSLVGGLIDILVYARLRKKNASNLVMLIVSLGLFSIIQNTLSLLFGDGTKSIRSGAVSQGLLFLGGRITPTQIAIILASLALCLLTWMVLRWTRAGRIVRAVANDEELSRIVGVDSNKVIRMTMMCGSGLAALAAILVSLDTDLNPMMGFNALLMGVVALIVGGLGSILGAAGGGLLVGLAQHLGVWMLPSHWQDAIVFVILIVFLRFRPQGILGRPFRRAA